MNITTKLSALLLFFTVVSVATAQERNSLPQRAKIFEKQNLVAWCIVPFDSAKRSPEERASMLKELGIKRLAYDYRAEHIPTFDREIEALKANDIELFAWWFPTVLNEEAKGILDVVKKHQVHPQLWVTGGGDANMTPEQAESFCVSEVERLRTIAVAANEIGCKVGLYNHGGWYGEPANQLELVRRLNMKNVGIVYNLHHAHDQLDKLSENMTKMRPYLLAVNLNGTQTNGERLGKKILPIGQGDRDKEVLDIIAKSGYQGPIGILNHTDEDARTRLQANMQGLDSLLNEAQQKR